MTVYTVFKVLTTDTKPDILGVSLELSGLGWSIIPATGKRAAVNWSRYQNQAPSPTQLKQWFTGKQWNVAVITGRVSSLIVLDFDEMPIYERFVKEQPQLANTLTVGTRRGVHLYFRCPPADIPTSTAAPGVDLQAEGRYVIAPGSVVDGHRYNVVHNRQPITLSAAQVESIRAFVQRLQPRCAAAISTEAESGDLLPGDAESYYRAVVSNGRNNALFVASLKARDNGHKLDWTINALAQVHAHARATASGQPESYQRRYREALATITSAYSRPPRRRTVDENRHDLPSTVKEALNRQKLTATWRTIQALREAGVRPGQSFTYLEARRLLAGIVGDWSIRRALHSGKGLEIFGDNPPQTPLTPPKGDVDTQVSTIQKNHAGFLVRQNQQKLKKRMTGDPGRPALLYQMPSNKRLCKILGVERLTSRVIDPVEAEALETAKNARIAMHRAYVLARPTNRGKEHRIGFLARRLGVCVRTVQRYNEALGVPRSPCFEEITPIYWSNLSQLNRFSDTDLKGANGGYFLMNSDGKKYPPLRSIAIKLLRTRRRISLYRRHADVWHYDQLAPLPSRPPRIEVEAPEPAAPTVNHFAGDDHEQIGRSLLAGLFGDARLLDRTLTPDDLTPGQRDRFHVEKPAPAAAPPTPPTPTEPTAPPQQPAPVIKRTPKKPLTAAQIRRKFSKPLVDGYAESLAERIRRACPGITEVHARALVYDTNPANILIALSVLEKRKNNVRSPEGFFITLVRLGGKRKQQLIEG